MAKAQRYSRSCLGTLYAVLNAHRGLLAAILLAASMRFLTAPFSAGPDVAQFWAFAKVFHASGFDFYRYADATLHIFPFKSWAFVYPPVWLLILGLSLAIAPDSLASTTVVESGWRLAMKTPIVIADLAIGVILYTVIQGTTVRKLMFTILWLFHPTSWYESSVFGQFDAVATMFLLGCLVLLEAKKYRAAFFLASLAAMTKQHTLMALAPVFAVSVRSMGWKRFLQESLLALQVMVLLSVPFTVTGNLTSYLRSVLLPGQRPGYQYPLVYAFSGIGSLSTYLHETFGWETSGLMQLCMPALAFAVLAASVLSYFRLHDHAKAALAGFLLFVGLSYQVNYQYLVVYIPIAILAASRAYSPSQKVFTLLLAVLPALWLWLFDVSFWFRYFQPQGNEFIPILSLLGLTNYFPDHVYVGFALTLMSVSLAYVFATFRTSCRRH